MNENETPKPSEPNPGTPGKSVVIRESSGIMQGALRPAAVKAQMALIQRLMKSVMVKDEDYGVIPGCKKPSLLKPGAEKLNVMFRLEPRYERTFIELGNQHLEVRSNCVLVHIPTGDIMGHGGGSCSTMEKKYRWRQGDRKCPSCGKTGTIIKGKEEYGGGWLCFGKKGGCGVKWEDGAKEIELQEVGQIENPDVADCRNTVEKMADKRAMIAADLNATGASAIFTQDIEDMPPEALGLDPSKKVAEAENNKGPAQNGRAAPVSSVTAKQNYENMVKLSIQGKKIDALNKLVAEYEGKAGKGIEKFIEEDYAALIKYIYSAKPASNGNGHTHAAEFAELEQIIIKKGKQTETRFHTFMNDRLTELNKTMVEVTEAEYKTLCDRIRSEVLDARAAA